MMLFLLQNDTGAPMQAWQSHPGTPLSDRPSMNTSYPDNSESTLILEESPERSEVETYRESVQLKKTEKLSHEW